MLVYSFLIAGKNQAVEDTTLDFVTVSVFSDIL